MTRTAAIVGGGIGGLATAAGLARAGWEVTVFERAERPAQDGTGLGIWPSALRALDRLGLGERARELGRLQPSGVILRPDGTRIATIDVERIKRKQGEPVYLLSRPVLLGILASAAPVVQFGHDIEDPKPLVGKFDLVVGADGINSRVRRMLFGDAFPLRHSGMMTWRGTVELDLRSGSETWGRGVKFGITPQEPGRTNWYAVLPAPQGFGTDLTDVFGDWHEPIPSILRRIDPGGVLRHDLHYLSPLPRYFGGTTVVLGDAAHAMTPDLGQGACQALIDAVVLTECLTGSSTVEDGLAAYDRRRRRPTQRLAAMSTRVNRLAQTRRLLPLRDAVIRLALAFGPPS
jgi:2-polyprenyl-6-methoxyphenol hydroxylase-like FAD-dependent oxidoreductase